jgi:diguanylate cyclase (GGDEF)-like protein
MRRIPMRILLVDEDIHQHSQFTSLLEQLAGERYQLHWCSSMAEAPASLQTGAYDLIFLDACLDHLLSRRMLSAAISQGCTTPIVMLCDAKRPDMRDKAIAAGATDYLYKGDIGSELLERVISYALRHNLAQPGENSTVYYDPLTGLPNRQLFLDRLSQAISRAERDQQTLALFCFDLDGFKKVNDSFGHNAGDQLIEMIAERLRDCVRKTDTVARISGDEFAILVEEIDSTNDVVNVAQKLIELMDYDFMLDGHQVTITSSVGIAVYPEAGKEVDTLLKNADLAKQKAKTLEGSHYRFYNEQMNAEAMSQLYREADLRRGLRRHEFELFYQPRISLASGRVVGVEALIRWRHPVRGIVMPDEFIPLSEDSGLIVPIGYWVVRQACADIRAMQEMGLPKVEVALNLSFKQFQDELFLEKVTEIIFSSGVDPHLLEFELTETAIMENAVATHRCMRSMNKLGPTFSLDDFGTGYSSFAHIQSLPIDSLKVDRSFIKNVCENKDDASIVKAMISLAHSLNMTVVAEGAETREQMMFLRNNHCDQVQGYYFSPPLEFTDLVQLIVNDNRRLNRKQS